MDEDIEMEDCTKEDKKEDMKKVFTGKKNHKYTIKEKLYFLQLAKEKGKLYVSNTFGITENVLETGKKIEVELQHQNNFNKWRLEGGGRKSQVPKEIEEHIASWILQNRKLGLVIKCNNIVIYAKKLSPELNEKTNNAVKCWCKRFLKKYNFTLRKISHMGQQLLKDYEIKIKYFLDEIKKKRKTLNISDEN